MDATKLAEEFDRVRPIAVNLRRVEGLTTTSAWASALQRICDTRRDNYSTKALSPALQRLLALQISTSGCEQTLSVQEWLQSSRKASRGESRELDELLIARHDQPTEQPHVFEEARRIWIRLFGTARQSKPRLRGWKRTPKAASAILSESRWLKNSKDRIRLVLSAGRAYIPTCSPNLGFRRPSYHRPTHLQAPGPIFPTFARHTVCRPNLLQCTGFENAVNSGERRLVNLSSNVGFGDFRM